MLRNTLWMILVCSISLGTQVHCALAFHDPRLWIEATDDTLLIYEPIYIAISVTNAGDEDLEYSPLVLADNFFSIRLYDSNGDSVGVILPTGDYAIQHDGPVLQPGDTLDVINDISLWTDRFNDSLGTGFVPPGEYTLVVGWQYDRFGRVLVGGSPYVFDSTTFVVVPPESSQIEARNAYLALRANALAAHSVPVRESWDFVSRCPSSPYAAHVLADLIPTLPVSAGELDTMTPSLFSAVRLLATEFPDYPRIAIMIRSALSRLPDSTGSALLESIGVSAPAHSRAAAFVKRNEFTRAAGDIQQQPK